ncbi:MAG TPA: DUF1292 domain-containing protein [Bacilli bacterium]|nr:DUF1292 domain-containing protein [Bacilli bacterium]
MDKIKVNKNGQEVEMGLILKFQTAEDGRTYVVYTDNSKDEDGKTNLYSYYYTTNENDLIPVPETEMDVVNEALKQVKENYSANE